MHDAIKIITINNKSAVLKVVVKVSRARAEPDIRHRVSDTIAMTPR